MRSYPNLSKSDCHMKLERPKPPNTYILLQMNLLKHIGKEGLLQEAFAQRFFFHAHATRSIPEAPKLEGDSRDKLAHRHLVSLGYLTDFTWKFVKTGLQMFYQMEYVQISITLILFS